MNKCESCKYYLFIDSCYGNCIKKPQVLVKITKWWQQPRYESTYPHVEWDSPRCAEYQEDKLKEITK